jgi:DNA-binding IclR family transcriptional regulator
MPVSESMPRLVPALSRGLDILEHVGRSSRPPSSAELATQLALPRTTMHELVTTLVSRDYLQEVPGAPRRYRLGVRTFELGNVYATGLDLAREGRRAAQNVGALCAETVHVAVRDGTEVVYVAKVDSTHSVRMVSAVGAHLPAHVTAAGKMLLSAVPDQELYALYPADRPLTAMTERSLRSADALHRELMRVHAEGVAWDYSESNVAVNCVAAPVYDHAGLMVAALSISAPTIRWNDDDARRYAELARAGAQTLSRALGYVEPGHGGPA